MAVKNYGIHDKWTNINKVNNVEIQSVDGVIENIKVNGEPAGGGGGDFTTANVTVTFNTGGYNLFVSYLITEDGETYPDTLIADSGSYSVIMYKSFAIGYARDSISATIPTINVTGNAQVVEAGQIIITGDCTITIS